MKKYAPALIVIFIIFIISCTQRSVEASGGWKTDEPEKHGLNKAVLEEMRGSIAGTEGVLSFLMVKDGCIVCEYYAKGYNKNSVFRLNSCSKSFISSLVGIAIDEGLIESTGVYIKDYFPQIGEDGKNEITIEHLLSMTAGWDWQESTAWNFRLENWLTAANRVDYVLERRQIYSPGEIWNYNTGAAQLLAAILQKVSGIPADEYAQRRLFGKIGIKSARWTKDNQGVTNGGFGLSMTARDAARFGQLYLNKGIWNEKIIIPKEWIDVSTTEYAKGFLPSSGYGLHWWVSYVTADRRYEMFYAMGFGGQYIFVIPEFNMTAVFTCDDSSSRYSLLPLYCIRSGFSRLVSLRH
jgi:CubicO group peptidase (beta-lactamase class C family)